MAYDLVPDTGARCKAGRFSGHKHCAWLMREQLSAKKPLRQIGAARVRRYNAHDVSAELEMAIAPQLDLSGRR